MATIKWRLIAVALLFAGCAGVQSAPTHDERQSLAPTGKLRVALLLGAPTYVVKEPATGEMKGVGFDLGKELAQRSGLPFEPVIYPSVGALIEGMKASGWDVAFLAVNPERQSVMDFTAPFLNIEHGFLVLSGSLISTMSEVDRAGIRVGVPQGGSVIPAAKQVLKNAVLVSAAGLAGGIEMLKAGQVDVFAANKANLFQMSDQLPGSRVLDGRFSTDPIALAMPKGREPALDYVQKFIERAKSDGLIKAAVKRAGLRGTVDE